MESVAGRWMGLWQLYQVRRYWPLEHACCCLLIVLLMILVEKRSSREPWAVVVEESTFRRLLCQGMR